MKVLVTGGAGFIGSHVVDRLVEKGHEVVVVDDLSTGRKENINPQAKFYHMDITSPKLEEVFQAEKPDFVNHHAAQMDVRKSIEDPLFDARVNILGTICLLECCCANKVGRIIFASSGGAICGEPRHLPVDERHPVSPISPYGLSKYTAEKYLRLYNLSHGLEYVALRYGNVYGPRQDPFGEAGVIAIFIGKMLRGKRPTIYGTGEQIRDYVYVGDVVEVNILAMEVQDGVTVNIGTGKGTSVNELFKILKERLGSNLDPIYAPPRMGELDSIFLEVSLAREKLGWSAQTDLVSGLDKTIDFFKERMGQAT
ncbi:MAG: SDR family oxidoreductase [Actinomycetota bacterium]|nr:SDR family oxidoreductase [Actinomycetota bacterium]